MKVALTHPYSWPEVRRGAERIIRETARALAGRGHDVTILTAGSTPEATTEPDGYRVITHKRWLKQSWQHEQWFGLRLLADLARGGFDVTHSFMPRDAVACIRTAARAGHRTLYDEMGLPGWSMQGPPTDQLWAGFADRRARLRVARDIDVYGCMSRFALAALEEHCGRTGVLIPGGVRIGEFRPAEAREPDPTILYSGALDVPGKGIHVLLEALARVAEDEPDVQLWLSGPGDPAATLDAAPADARRRTTVLPLGAADEQSDRYGRAWVTSLPSWGDSFGMVTLESLASGTPIAVTDSAAPQEMVTPGTGAVARAGDAASLAEALLHCLQLSRSPETAAACVERARPYDWDDGLAPLLERYYTAPLDELAAIEA